MPDHRDFTPAVYTAIELVERRIRTILLDLEETTGFSIDYVTVDTRNWGQLRTEIALTKTKRI
jgi:hypothetical protein